MKRHLKKAWGLFKDLGSYFYRGYKNKLLSDYTGTFFTLLLVYVSKFRHALPNKRDKKEQLKRLYTLTKGLHSVLSYDGAFHYSVLLAVDDPSPLLLESCLRSVCRQTAPSCEIVLGFKKPASAFLKNVIEKIKKEFSMPIRECLTLGKERVETLNLLAEAATGNFLLVVEQEDWLRPDLLFRYEQTLRSIHAPMNAVIYSDENLINHLDHFLSRGEVKKTALHFPYFFEGTFHLGGCLFSKHLWKKSQGLSTKYPGAEVENFILQLQLNGAHFYHIPLSLYSKRFKPSQPLPPTQRESFLGALNEYSQTLKLDWKWLPGYREQDVRAIPTIKKEHQVQVIIPFKDQKELTMKCVHALLKQKHVRFKITAVDNNSKDGSIREEIMALGGEVLISKEPFNYSRLNNFAVTETQIAQDCDVLLFLNNDVELHEEAILEMLRWIDQPQIGIVGCRLHYPNGLLQHGGVRLDYYQNPGLMSWIHIEKLCRFEEMQETKALAVVDAVTAACAMMKRQVFLDVGGFDEVWYPVANSDTNLAVKVELKGLKSFYTPYAYGVHHESISRQIGIEDFENLTWLHRHLLINQHRMPAHSFPPHLSRPSQSHPLFFS